MSDLISVILEGLKDLDIPIKKTWTEEDFEDIVYDNLEVLIDAYDKSILLKRQQISNRETRQLKPDIVIGLNEILIELKYNIKNFQREMLFILQLIYIYLFFLLSN